RQVPYCSLCASMPHDLYLLRSQSLPARSSSPPCRRGPMESKSACESSYTWVLSIPSAQIRLMIGSSVGKDCACSGMYGATRSAPRNSVLRSMLTRAGVSPLFRAGGLWARWTHPDRCPTYGGRADNVARAGDRRQWRRQSSPDLWHEVLRANHGIAWLAVERLREGRHVRDRTVGAPFRGCVRVDRHSREHRLGPGVLAPGLSVGDEEALLRSVAVDRFAFSGAVERAFHRVVGSEEAAVISDVLTERELAIHVRRIDLDVAVELIDYTLCLFVEPRRIARDPPVAQVAVGVVVAALVVEAVRELVTSPASAERAVVGSHVATRVESLR